MKKFGQFRGLKVSEKKKKKLGLSLNPVMPNIQKMGKHTKNKKTET